MPASVASDTLTSLHGGTQLHFGYHCGLFKHIPNFFLSTILSNKFVFIPNFPSSNLLIYWEKKYVLSAEYFLDTDLGFGDPVVLKMFYHTGTWTHVPGFELDQNPAWDSNSHGWDSNPAKTHSNETRVPVVLSQW